MSENGIVWNMFGKAKRRKDTKFVKEVPMATSYSDLAGQLGKYLENEPGPSTATAAMMQQQLDELRKEAQVQKMMQQQAAQQLGQQTLSTSNTGNWVPSVWTSPYPGTASSPTTTPYTTTTVYPGEELNTALMKQLMTMQIVNLIANVGPVVAKRIMLRYKVQFDHAEFDVLCKELKKIMSGDDDEDLEKVINDVAKEVKL